MSKFQPAFDFMIKNEGGYVFDPADPGGETCYGISKRSYPDEDIPKMTIERAHFLYYRDFWKRQYEQIVDQQLANKVFDFSVNMGASTACRLLQQAINFCGWAIPEDGILGPETLKRANSLPAANLESAVKLMAARHYKAIAAANPAEEKFLAGWIRRAEA
jgi:lysozyme family protein